MRRLHPIHLPAVRHAGELAHTDNLLVRAICRRGALWPGVRSAADTLLAELFPTKIRYTGISISFNIAIMSFGGFTPFMNTYLVAITGTSVAPAFGVMAIAVLSGIAMLMTKDHTNIAFD